MKAYFTLIFVCLLAITQKMHAQTSPGEATEQVTIQPTIMAVPFVKADQDIRTTIEDDQQLRIALSAVKQGFDKREFTTYDFIALYKAMERRDITGIEDQSSLKQQVIETSGTDIYVDTDLIINEHTGNAITVEVILQAYDQFTGQSLANAIGRHGPFITDRIGVLVEQASEKAIEHMLDVMLEKFVNIRSEGRSVVINFTLSNDASINMDEPVGPKSIPLKFVIRDWLKQNAHDGYYHLKGSTKTSISVDDFRIPANGQLGDLEYEMYSFFQDLGLSATTSLVGQELVVSITE